MQLPSLPILVWILAFCRCFLYSLIATGGALVQALMAKPWGERTGTEQFVLVLILLGIQAGIILAFIDQALAKLSAKAGVDVPNPPAVTKP